MAVPKKRVVLLDCGTIKQLGKMTKEQRWNFFALMLRRIRRIQDQEKANRERRP